MPMNSALGTSLEGHHKNQYLPLSEFPKSFSNFPTHFAAQDGPFEGIEYFVKNFSNFVDKLSLIAYYDCY